MTPSLLPTFSEPPLRAALVDVDGTLFLFMGIFLSLYLVLRYALFRPVLRVLDERERRIEGSKAEAKEMQQRAEEAYAQYEAFVREARQKGGELKTALRQEGQRIERALLDEVRRESEAQLSAGKAELRAEMERAAATLGREAEAMAQDVAARLLGRPVGSTQERRSAP